MLRNTETSHVSIWQRRIARSHGFILAYPSLAGLSLMNVNACVQGFEVGQFLHYPWPTEAAVDAEVDISPAWIQAALERLDSAGRAVYVLLPVQRVMFECLSFPGLSESDRRSAVQTHVETLNESHPEMVPADHLDIPGHPCTVVVTMRRHIVERWQSALSSSGYQMAGISCAELEACSEVSVDGESRVDVIRSSMGLTLVASESGIPWGSRSIPLPQGDWEQLERLARQESRRLMASIPPVLRSSKTPRLCFDHCAIPIASVKAGDSSTSVNGYGQVESSTQALMRSIAQRLQSKSLRFNTLSVRRLSGRMPAWLARRTRLYALGGFAMIAIAAWGIVNYRQIVSENREMLSREQAMRKAYALGQDRLEVASVIDEWQASGNRVGDSLAAFLNHLPDSKRVLLTQVQVDTESSPGETTIRASGQAVDSDAVVQLQQEIIRAAEQYELHPQGIDSVGGDAGFPAAFSFEVLVPNTGGE